jgi:tRNA dimethylallyltransferase
MAAAESEPELLVIVGPTASGKSALALRLAKELDGEIIAADSRTIYKGMDVGTAKPTSNEQEAVPHWGLDLVEPGQRYSAHAFQQYAEAKIKDINSRSKLPIVTGGTGLYVDSLLFDYQFSPAGSERDEQNPRHLKQTGRPADARIRPGVLLIGLMPPDEVLRANITRRAEKMFDQGVIDETRRLVQTYGEQALTDTAGIIYRVIIQLIKGDIVTDEAIERFKHADWQYARRQKTWFKRNPRIQWFSSADEAYSFIAHKLNN